VTEGGYGEEDQGACLANPVLHLDASKLVWGENSRAELGEKCFDPQVCTVLQQQKAYVIWDNVLYEL